VRLKQLPETGGPTYPLRVQFRPTPDERLAQVNSWRENAMLADQATDPIGVLRSFLVSDPGNPYARTAQRRIVQLHEATTNIAFVTIGGAPTFGTVSTAFRPVNARSSNVVMAAAAPVRVAEVYSGALAPYSYANRETTANAIVAENSLKLRNNPSRISYSSATLAVGQPVRVINPPDEHGWARVATDDEKVGYIYGVVMATAAEAIPPLTLTFADDPADDERTLSSEELAQFSERVRALDNAVVMNVGLMLPGGMDSLEGLRPAARLGTVADADLAAYRRSLRLFSRLTEQGVDPARVSVVLPEEEDASASANTIELVAYTSGG
jgi:hypothetical protein